MPNRIWLTWEVQRRNKSLSTLLGAKLFELTLCAPFWRRYPILIIRTIQLIRQTKPDIIFSQNPSLVLAGLSVLVGRIMRTPVIIDAHNAGLYPLEGESVFLNKIAAFINRSATLVIVSNDCLKQYVESKGGVAISIPDPIPSISCDNSYDVGKEIFNVVFVCSWAEDEPYLEVIQAAKLLDSSFRIFITGNYKHHNVEFKSGISKNITLTGFISNEDYEGLLCVCDAVMVLTKREDCLVCGGYEGVSAQKPLILSNTKALMHLFSIGCVYTPNTVDGIRQAIEAMSADYNDKLSEIKKLKTQLKINTESNIRELERILGNGVI